MSARLPTIYVPHGGGPWPFAEVGFAKPEAMRPLRSYLEGLITSLPEAPKAVLCVSAHFEVRVPTVTTSAHPPMLYDYFGFPEESYRITWSAPGSPALAARVRELLGQAGIESAADPERGFDHGTFVPLKLADPKAELPTVQLSLVAGLDPEEHLRLGRALAPLRDEGVLILGSGSSYHNLGAFFRAGARAASEAFHGWLVRSLELPPGQREGALTRWLDAPEARACHPREEHLLPLHVVLGAANGDAVTFPFRGDVLGVEMLAAQFGG